MKLPIVLALNRAGFEEVGIRGSHHYLIIPGAASSSRSLYIQ